MIILLLFAFIGGIVTILSPCILPILPIILSSSAVGGKSRPYGIVAGFIGSFTFFTLFLTSIVQATGVSANALRLFSVVIIGLFGLSLVLPQAQKLIEKGFSILQSKLQFNNANKTGFSGGILIGMSLGLLWTPCVGPILASVISLALTGSVTGSAALITFAYALGTAIPMFLIIRGGQKILTNNQWLLKHTEYIQQFFGVIMIITALAIYFNVDRSFQQYILQTFPQYGTGLTSLEDNAFVQDALDNFGTTDEDMIGKTMDEVMDENMYPMAPEIIQGGEIFNWDKPSISIKELTSQNKVVLVDFWTYSCINCIRTLPYLTSWHEKYSDDGLVIIGVHSPEFEFEKSPSNVAAALDDFDIFYPVVQDNNFETWRAYHNRYWPAKYLIDTNGRIRYTHFGEGEYNETEEMIQELLEETGTTVDVEINNTEYENYTQTPETYLGYRRIAGFASPEGITRDVVAEYSYPSALSENKLAFQGKWLMTDEYSESQEDASLKLHFYSKDVYLVLGSKTETEVEIYLDGEYIETILVKENKLYDILNLDDPGEHILELRFIDTGIQAFAFTFG